MLSDGRNGFTLLELSIVLVIIGLIAGGVLVGRELIKAAEVQKEISALSEFEVAIHTFTLKYSAVPGDATQAQLNGGLPGVDGAAYGDGNGQIGCCDTNVGYPGPFYEGAYAWAHLSAAGLIPGNYDGNANNSMFNGNVIPAGNFEVLCSPTTCPPAALNQTSVHMLGMPTVGPYSYHSPLLYSNDGSDPAYNTQWENIFIVIKNPIIAITTGSVPITGNLTVDQAYAIDAKLDDGIAYSGRVITRNANAGATGCINGDSSGNPAGGLDDGSANPALGHPYDYNSATDTADDCELIYLLP